MANEKINSGKYVELIYDLYAVNEDGTETLVHQSDPADPEKIVYGVTPGVIVPLEKALDGLEQGQPFDVVATAEESFGPVDPEKVVTLPKEIFEIDGKFDAEAIVPGVALPMMTADGFRLTGIVKEVKPTEVIMDFNHPLSGKNVHFKGTVLTVRDATEDDLKPDAGCGCGCDSCGDGCGCSSEGNCGDGSCGCK